MKPIKMLGLAALAALMAMAFVGASSAMAESTALCKVDSAGGACPEIEKEKTIISHVHEATSGTKALLLGSVKVECDALFLGDTTNLNEKKELTNLGAPLTIEGHFTYSNCVTGSTKCEVKEASASSTIEVLKLGHELADVTGAGEVNVHCGIFINCTYNGQNLKGHALGPLLSGDKEDGKGPANGETRVEEQVTHIVKGFCPETAKLDILTTPLEATYIGS